MNNLPGLAWDRDPPDLSLPSSQDYRHEPLRLATSQCFLAGAISKCLFHRR
jgi:hypothetical protein